jgi:hypothetical protein
MSVAKAPRTILDSCFTYLWVIAAFAAITALYFYPTFPSFGTAIIGPPEDNTMFTWFLWYGSRAIADPSLHFFHTTLMYHPEGMGLWFANYFYVGVVVAVFLKPLLGLAATYNILVLLSFVLSGLSAYLLIRYLIGDGIAAFFGAFIYAFNPMHFGHALHHPSVASLQFLPLYILFIIRANRHGGWVNRGLAAGVLALAGYCDWNYLIYGWLCLGFLFLWTWLRERRISLEAVMNILGIGIGSFMLTAPVLIPMLLEGIQHTNTTYLPGHNIFVADLWGFVIPSAFHPFSGYRWVQQINGSMTGPPWESAVYLGWINIILVLMALMKGLKQSLPYLTAFLICVLFALGVELHIGGWLTGIRLPYALLESVPLLKHARNPSRVMAFGYIFWAILCAGGLKLFFRASSKKKPIRHIGLVLVLGLGFMDFYSVAADVTPLELPPVYKPIVQDSEYADRGFAIMNIPWDKGRYMMEQTLHGLPDLQGYLGRKFSVPLIGRLPFDDLKRQREILTENRVKYVLVRKKRMSWDPSNPEEVRIYGGTTQIARKYAQAYTKVYEDDRDALFRVY